mgnify:CR=1 FL=1
MKQAIPKLEAFVEFIGGLARLCVLALVVLVAANVILRYLFSIGPVALQELEWHLISPIALFGLAYAMKHKADVRVDFVYERFGPLGKGWIDLFSAVLTFLVALVIVYLSVPYVMQSFDMMEGSPDPGGLPYRWFIKSFIVTAFVLLALAAISRLTRVWAALFTHNA